MQEIEDSYVITAMIQYGGGFVSKLGEAARYADDENLRRIKITWPDYWTQYTKIATKNLGLIRICDENNVYAYM